MPAQECCTASIGRVVEDPWADRVRAVAPRDRTAAQEASEMLPDGLVTIDHRGRVVHLNSIASRILGVELEAAVGRPVREAIPLQEHDGTDWWELTNPWGGLRTRTGHRERLLVLGDGREVLVTARYLRPGRNEPVVAVLLGVRGAEARIRAERDHAALITTVAHELRSPLTGVKGFTGTLLTNWDRFSDEQKQFMVEAINADADRINRLITDLLDVSRLDAHRMAIHPVHVDVATLLTDHALRAQGTASDREIVVDCPPGLQVHADPDRLDQLVANLLENALRHGSGTVTMKARPADREGWVDVAVVDEGAGIAPEHRALAFMRFWQSQARAQGSGLGLYLVRGLARAHGGDAIVVEAPDGRAHIHVRLPASPPAD